MKIETVTSDVQTVALSELRLAKENVRKVKPKAIDQLAEDIAAHGVLQSCIVYQDENLFYVVGGGRRYRALRVLEKDKRIEGDYAVPVQVRDRSQAVELSLAENIQREDMNPADCIRAFGALEAEDHAPEDIAARFGASKTYVKQMLKLASLDKRLIAAMGKDELSVETARVLTRAASKAEQVRLYEAHGNNAHSIRYALAEGRVESDHRFYRFVGREAYEAAGGTISSDLFGDTAFVDDPELLLKLTVDAIEAAADAQRAEGWAKVSYDLENAYHSYAHDTARPDAMHEPSKKVAGKIAALEKQVADEIARADADDEYADTYEAEHKLRELRAPLAYFSDALKGEADLSLIIDHKGALQTRASVKSKPVQEAEQAKADQPSYSASLVEQLTTLQTIAVQQQVARDPELALTLLLTSMVETWRHSWNDRCVGVHLDTPTLRKDAVEIAGDMPLGIEDALAVIDQIEADDVREQIAAMSAEQRMALLAALTALHLTPVRGDDPSAAIAPLGRQWKPDAAFFAKLRKPVMLDILRDELGEDVANNCKTLKKPALAEECANRLAGRDWLPYAVAR